MRATFLIACLAGLVGTVSAYGSLTSDPFGGYTGGMLIPFEFLPTTGDNFTTFQTCAGDAAWPAAGGTFNISLGLEGCKTQCENAYTAVGQASYASYSITQASYPWTRMESGMCCCQAITTTQISAPSCIADVVMEGFLDSVPGLTGLLVTSYLYKEHLPGSCQPWLSRCKNSGTGGGWDQTCFTTNAVLAAPEYTQEAPDTSIWGGTEVVWEAIIDEGSTSCSATDSNVFNGTEGSCTAVIIPDWDGDGTPSPPLYAAGYCDSAVDSGTFAIFYTELECLAWAGADSSYNYNYSWSNDAELMWSGMESGSCAYGPDGISIQMTCGNWCSDSSGDDWCNALHSALVGAAKAFGTMLLVIIIVCVVVTCLGIIGCWYCCCRNKDQQVIIVQGQGQAGIPMATPMTQQQPPGAVYMKNGVWLDKNERPIPAQQV